MFREQLRNITHHLEIFKPYFCLYKQTLCVTEFNLKFIDHISYTKQHVRIFLSTNILRLKGVTMH